MSALPDGVPEDEGNEKLFMGSENGGPPFDARVVFRERLDAVGAAVPALPGGGAGQAGLLRVSGQPEGGAHASQLQVYPRGHPLARLGVVRVGGGAHRHGAALCGVHARGQLVHVLVAVHRE
eukprot:ctg_1175.g370